jgi:hypothetical protein
MSLTSSVPQRLRSRSFVFLVHAGLWLLLILILTGLGGRTSQFGEARLSSDAPRSPVPLARLDRLFAKDAWPKPPADPNALDPFFTRHFNPIHPVAPPPTTRDIALTYRGFYQVGDGPKQTQVKLDNSWLETPVGSNVTANLFVAAAEIESLTLTNPAGQTNLLPLNVKTQLKVPIR